MWRASPSTSTATPIEALSRRLLQSQPDNVPVQRDLARGLLFASTVHTSLASRSAAAPDVRSAHRQRAVASYEEGQRLMARLQERGRLSGEDSVLLAQTRTTLAATPSRP